MNHLNHFINIREKLETVRISDTIFHSRVRCYFKDTINDIPSTYIELDFVHVHKYIIIYEY